jgi:hypothetical protein
MDIPKGLKLGEETPVPKGLTLGEEVSDDASRKKNKLVRKFGNWWRKHAHKRLRIRIYFE